MSKEFELELARILKQNEGGRLFLDQKKLLLLYLQDEARLLRESKQEIEAAGGASKLQKDLLRVEQRLASNAQALRRVEGIRVGR